ncbi:hypothetical protein M2318_000392 [Metapseudomonas resinovorans]|nr:M20/M25/M40 family metallo-hydrolase [Pseudomonas resinovorans]MDE3739986.1 M20/M25/M40 family metallo-hydrolase [Pseudomonas resinovorans]
MLMAHQDVVPIAEGTEKNWSVDPFAGTIKDGYIWGRGSRDDKGNLLSMLEAIEVLPAQGVRPEQTIYIVAGHDEEAGGRRLAGESHGYAAQMQRLVMPGPQACPYRRQLDGGHLGRAARDRRTATCGRSYAQR